MFVGNKHAARIVREISHDTVLAHEIFIHVKDITEIPHVLELGNAPRSKIIIKPIGLFLQNDLRSAGRDPKDKEQDAKNGKSSKPYRARRCEGGDGEIIHMLI
jgi:hypothetical protein